MRHFLGIYGFEFSNNIQLNGLHLTPITTSEWEAKKLAESKYELNLTGIGEFTDCKEQDLPSSEIDKFWHLPGILTFCQQREVILSLTFSEPDDIEIQNIFETLPQLTKIRQNRERHGKKFILPDKANLDRLLNLCFDKLGDKKFNEDTGLVQAFYRNVETFKLSEPFPEITYYFTFSALEILARCHQNHSEDKNVAKVLTDFLCAIGFTVRQDNPKQRRLGMQTYAHLRNALFHNGKFEITVPENGNSITLRLEDYNGNFERLLPDVLLRVIGYDDPSINWDRWSNRLLW